MAKKRNPRDVVVGDVKRLRAEVREAQKDARWSDKLLLQILARVEKLENKVKGLR